MVRRRLSSLEMLLMNPESTNRTHLTELSDAQVDLVDFCRRVHFDSAAHFFP